MTMKCIDHCHRQVKKVKIEVNKLQHIKDRKIDQKSTIMVIFLCDRKMKLLFSQLTSKAEPAQWMFLLFLIL
ncbi:hypothetical protein MED121_10644 [Marinomonas sp. MED121]|nr:hypothetical protein MED121_10644 [Marinomonas sp. MED121]